VDNKTPKSETKATRQAKHYIFRWKDSGVCVDCSRSRSAEECWAFALEWLRPAFSPPDAGKALVRKNGEVIEDGE
jgi:hypothetical protein